MSATDDTESAARMSANRKISRICQGCQKSQDDAAPFKNCSGCWRAHYCSVLCQKSDWKRHKPTCVMNRNARAVSSPDGFDSRGFDKWRDSRRMTLIPLYVREVPQERDCGKICLHLIVKPDPDPKLDGYRVIGHYTQLVSEMPTGSLPRSALDQFEATSKSNAWLPALVMIHLQFPRSSDGTRSFLMPLACDRVAYAIPFPPLSIEKMYQVIHSRS